jgi:hypothetical protein
VRAILLLAATAAGTLAPGSLRAQTPEQPRKLLVFEDAHCGFQLPPYFERCPPQSDADVARRARIFTGEIEQETCFVSLRVDRGDDITTARMVTRTAAARPLDFVRFVEITGEPGADVRWTGDRFAVHQRVIGRGRHGIELEVQIPLDASPGTEGCARAVLESLDLLPVREEHGWTDPEVRDELRRCFPGKSFDRLRVCRSAHYILLTDASAKDNVLSFLEENAVPSFHRLFPWVEQPKPGRLLEVILFRNELAYQEYCLAYGLPPRMAERTRGHASGSHHATWYCSPRDPTHFHEAIHQLVASWMRLDGGGPWFQEGLAEYAEAIFLPRNLHRLARNQVRSGTVVPLRRLVVLEDLLESEPRGASPQDRYNQVASLIGFVREVWPERFRRFVEELGVQPPGDAALIEAALRRSLGLSIDALDVAWRAFLLREGTLAQR